MLPDELRRSFEERIRNSEHPRELAVDLLFALQEERGHLTDEAVEEGARLLGMTPLELDELATFYNFLYRRPVGKYVIHVCDSAVCWMLGGRSVADHLCATLGIEPGGTTPDGLFSVLPVCCIGYCDRGPAMLVNLKVYGELTPEKVDRILSDLRADARAGVRQPVAGPEG